MELSVLVAKMATFMYLGIGIASLRGQLDFKKVMDSIERSQGLTIIIGILSIIIGFLLVEHHNIWVKDWPVLITIIGWGALLKGVLYLTFPKYMFEMSRGMVKNAQSWSYFVVIIGLVFGYFGFIA